jgi:hypothetical protein
MMNHPIPHKYVSNSIVVVQLTIHPSQIPGTPTFLKRCGDATVLGGYLDNMVCTSTLLVAFLNAAVDSQTA